MPRFEWTGYRPEPPGETTACPAAHMACCTRLPPRQVDHFTHVALSRLLLCVPSRPTLEIFESSEPKSTYCEEGEAGWHVANAAGARR